MKGIPMGTRHLIGVVLDGDFKVAQYGQWDGYPSGQGSDILKFLTAPEMKVQNFIEQVRRLTWITNAEVARIESEHSNDWPRLYPWLSRDAGADVLTHVYNGEAHATGLTNTWGFGYDSLFCEWAYVIDLDAATLEVYSGSASPVIGRWSDPTKKPASEGSDGYGAVSLIKVYDIHNLPDAATFCAELEAGDDDD